MKNLRTYICLIMIAATSLSFLYAQGGGPDRMKRYKEEKVAYFNNELDFSEEEATRFWPLYNDFHNRMMKINDDERNILNFFEANESAMSNKEVEESLEKYKSIQESRAKLHHEFHEKFIDLLGSRKTMELYTMERKFRMHILNTFKRGRGQGQGLGQGQGQGQNGRQQGRNK